MQYYSDPALDHDPDPPDIYNVAWLPYTAGSPNDLQWTVSGIYMDADTLTPEVFEPGILNPDEEMVIQAKISPSVAMTTTNLITIDTPNGISASRPLYAIIMSSSSKGRHSSKQLPISAENGVNPGSHSISKGKKLCRT